jgi:antitoxin CptB
MDLLLGPFADAAISGLLESELELFEALLEVPEPDLYAWIIGTADTPPDYDTPLLRKIRAFHDKPKS